jgi:hypothetical protein
VIAGHLGKVPGGRVSDKIASGDEATDDGTEEAENEAGETQESTEAVKGHGADEAFSRHGQ